MTPGVTFADVTAAETHDLRRRILRDGDSGTVVERFGDGEASTVRLAASTDRRVLISVFPFRVLTTH